MKGHPRLLEDGPGQDVETRLTSMAIPPTYPVGVRLADYLEAATVRAVGMDGPADALYVLNASLLVREVREDRDQVHGLFLLPINIPQANRKGKPISYHSDF